jgi:hypothetical protein
MTTLSDVCLAQVTGGLNLRRAEAGCVTRRNAKALSQYGEWQQFAGEWGTSTADRRAILEVGAIDSRIRSGGACAVGFAKKLFHK